MQCYVIFREKNQNKFKVLFEGEEGGLPSGLVQFNQQTKTINTITQYLCYHFCLTCAGCWLGSEYADVLYGTM